jgi:hypothetical protein
MPHQLTVEVLGRDDSDDDERENLARQLRQELLAHDDIVAAYRPSSGAEDGAKGDLLEWATLVVTAAGTAPAIVQLLRGWSGRHRGSRLRLRDGDDVLELEEPSDEVQSKAVEEWLGRRRVG